jgi:hypothetical protein
MIPPFLLPSHIDKFGECYGLVIDPRTKPSIIK